MKTWIRAPMFRYPVRKLHNIIGLVVGFQLLFWTASGLFFTIFPIEKIRGTTLRAPINHGTLALEHVQVEASQAADLLEARAPVKSVELAMFFGEPVWKLEVGEETRMVNAQDGRVLSPISPELAKRVAVEGMLAKAGEPAEPWLMVEDPPREYSGPLPAYVVDYEPGSVRVYIDASTGRLVTVRSNLWRTFDVLWRFHIMDITGADRFDSWWLKLFAFFGLTMVLTGAVLLVRRVRNGLIFR